MATGSNIHGDYALVNGLNIYYEIHGAGTGTPLVLLHGGLGTIAMFAQLLPDLSKDRQVIGVELQAHGHTADIDRPLSFEHMGDDIAALITHLGLGKADVFGYSLGGGAALQAAIRHPDVVRKLVLASAPCKREGWYPEVLAGMAQMNADAARAMLGSPPHEAYIAAAPRPEDWPVLIVKVGELLKQDYDWSEGVAAMKMPVLILVGDADSVRISHAADMFGLLGGGKVDGAMGGQPDSQLAVLPGTTHFTILEWADPLLPVLHSFLDGPEPKAG
jgi:pimeloyl-ACP methyl ester carboxylesterase